MSRIVESQLYGRLTREAANIDDLGIPTWSLIREAIQSGERNRALELIAYLRVESRIPGFPSQVSNSLTYIADNHGEPHVEKALRWWRTVLQQAGNPVRSFNFRELVYYQAEEIRGEFRASKGRRAFAVTEESDRIILSLDPCGTGGWLRRIAQKNPSHRLGVTRQSYPWSWGKTGVPYFCTHCCIWWEIMEIEAMGYPLRVHEFPDDAQEPCRIIYYRKPDLIPDQYFERVGIKKG